MPDTGYIKLFRKALDNELYNEKPFDRWHAFEDIMLLARYSDGKLLVDGSIVEMKRGQFFTSHRKLADRWGWSTKKVGNFLKLLSSLSMIEQKGNTSGTLVTLRNYGVYQDSDEVKGNTEESLRKHSGNAEETLGNQKEESKERKKDIYNPPICPPLEPKKAENRKTYGEFGLVRLSDDEYGKLAERLGKSSAADYIERLDGWLAEGNRKKNHYATILNWWRKDGSVKQDESPKKRAVKPSCAGYDLAEIEKRIMEDE